MVQDGVCFKGVRRPELLQYLKKNFIAFAPSAWYLIGRTTVLMQLVHRRGKGR